MGYTGNFVCGVWFGNDNYDPTNRMTGGSLPAMTWHSIMEYAHQGIEIKQLPGVAVPPARPESAIAEVKSKSDAPPPRPIVLTKKGADILTRVEHMMDEANRAMGPVPSAVSTSKKKQAAVPDQGDALATALEGHAFGTQN
jgi:penicillin-binding protein 1A